MHEGFELPVYFENKELSLPAKLIQSGYSYKIEVDINGTMLSFERDEERNWRALLSNVDIEQNKSINIDLVRAVVESLESNLS